MWAPFFHFLIFHIGFVQSKVQGADGVDFSDDFGHHNKKLWQIDDDKLDCNGEDCVYLSKSSLRFIYHPATFWWREAHSEVQLNLADNCNSDTCCDGTICARFTGGAIVSLTKYGYGAFEYIMLAANGPRKEHEGDSHVVSSCFSLGVHESGFHESVIMGISMCIDSNLPWVCSLLIQYGEESSKYQEHFHIGFDASKKPAHFRIEWHPNLLEFFINRNSVKVLRQSMEVSIPDRPMHINLIVVPQAVQEERRPDLEFVMHIYRVKYTKFEDANQHIDLFVEDQTSFNYVSILFLFGFISLFTLIFMRSEALEHHFGKSSDMKQLSTKLISNEVT